MLTYEITEDNKILASNIKRCRTKLKESQFDFAENCGISVEILSLIERGIANPKLSTTAEARRIPRLHSCRFI